MKIYSLVLLLISTVFAQNGPSPTLPDCSIICYNDYYGSSETITWCTIPSGTSQFACCIAEDCSPADQEALLTSALIKKCTAPGTNYSPPSLICPSVTVRTVTKGSNFSIISLASTSTSSIISPASLSTSSFTSSASLTSPPPSSSPSTNSSTLASQTPTSSSGPLIPNASSNNGLSVGAKAGIVIGALAAVLTAVLLIFLFLRRQTSKKAIHPDEPAPLETELPTKSNTHEIGGRKIEHITVDTPEEKYSLSPHQGVPELPAVTATYSIQRNESSTSAINHELGASQSMVQGGRLERKQAPQQTFSQPYLPTHEATEVYDERKGKTTQVPHTQDGPWPESSSVLDQALLSETSGSTSRMEELRAKSEKIKVEKERLLRLQELDEAQAALQREMQEEQRKSMGKMTRR